jgi:hypothetical protein
MPLFLIRQECYHMKTCLFFECLLPHQFQEPTVSGAIFTPFPKIVGPQS